jgi:hypothetical protein
MVRVILGLLLVAALALLATSLLVLVRAVAAVPPNRPATGPKDDPMPDALRNIAYVLLLILLFGVASGWLGA